MRVVRCDATAHRRRYDQTRVATLGHLALLESFLFMSLHFYSLFSFVCVLIMEEKQQQ